MPARAIDVFREACGLLDPWVLQCTPPDQPPGVFTSHRLESPFAFLGRDSQADIVLEDPRVSRRHACLQVIEGRLFCLDLNSRTGLRWDTETERRVQGWLDPGCSLRVGPYSIREAAIESPAEHAEPVSSPECPNLQSLTRSDLPRVDLELPMRVAQEPSLWRMAGRIALLGRSESCDLILSHESISRTHASLIRTSKGVWIVDLLAREGVLVNGVKVKWAWLDDADTVQIGQFTFHLRYETRPRMISRSDVPLEAGSSPPSSRRSQAQRAEALPRARRTDLAVRARRSSPVSVPEVVSSLPSSPPALLVEGTAGYQPDMPISHSQLALWQQQMRMMESFHDDMMLMVQMFVAMHKEHLGAVKHELDKVRNLTQELGVLQGKLEEPLGLSDDGLSAGAESPAADGLSTLVIGNGSLGKGGAKATSRPQAGARQPTPSPGSPFHVAIPPSMAPAPESAARSEGPGSRSENQAGLHSDLTRRISELQRERQGYWQRILGAINKQSI
jgi:pSer/pThr/pTyr-binding forkhead associated (FHA) protein